MRMRKKANLEPRMEACAAWQVKDPVAMKGSWRSLYPQARELWVEIGCGKGKFTVETAQANPDILLIAIERCREAMVMAMEKARDMGLTNVFFVDLDVALMEGCFAFGEIDRMFINFPDPWPRSKNAKRRLTSSRFLACYETFLKPEGLLEFKTDNRALFDFSLESIPEAGWYIQDYTFDLHHSPLCEGNVMTEYEERFSSMGHPICKLIAGRRQA